MAGFFNNKPAFFLTATLLVAAAVVWQPWHLLEPEVDFNAQIRPIINTKCISCHGGVKQSGGFSLLFREDALGKTKSGKPAIVPGHPGKSEFIRLLTHSDPEERMPLGKDPLSEEEITLLKRWIRQGAEWEDHWAFIKPKPVAPPDLGKDPFVKNEIDLFILDKLREKEMTPSPEAGRAVLLRRASLDLTGLPPGVEEVEQFCQDQSPDAWEKAVDRLLASPRYGEKWAGMWLDLARFSDTKGYEKDLHRNIWRYRDYVIRSFNEDKPYDQFTIEQLAGDLLPKPTEDQIIATAFHRNTMNNDEGGTDNEEFRTSAVIDRVNTTFDVWQGLTMACVQCHSHPYDPIRQKEYYRFMAFLNNTQDNDVPEETPLFISALDFDSAKAGEIIRHIRTLKGDRSPDAGLSLKAKRRKYLLSGINATDFDTAYKVTADQVRVRMPEPGAFVAFREVDLSAVEKVGVSYMVEKGGHVEVRLDRPGGPLLTTLKLGSTFGEWYYNSKPIKPGKGTHTVFFVAAPDEKGAFDIALRSVSFVEKPAKDKKQKAQLDSLRGELAKAINPSGTPVLRDLPAEQSRKTHVFVRGNWMSKGDPVRPGVPQALNPFPKGVPANRLGMARWLVAAENPLTARVAVNRFWEQLFGTGLVETLEDFGSQGMKPTHPELLDWLAVTYQKDYRWSTKKLLKLIVMSGTYRQSSQTRPEHLQQDPGNRYYARAPRVRLSAEQIRDQALAVSGLLSDKLYGPSVMPLQPEGVFQAVFGGIEWKQSKGEDLYRRALYTYLRRTSPYASLITFDAPTREFCVLRRIRTNTPLQALVTLNDTVYTEAAVGLAKRMAAGGNTIKEQIRTGFRAALLRDPDPKELGKFMELYTRAGQYYKTNPAKAAAMTGSDGNGPQLAPLTIVASSFLNLDEFVTKE
jgi:hypothetical protein